MVCAVTSLVVASPEAAALAAEGDAFDKAMKTSEALAAYEKALALSPNDSVLLRKIAKQYAELIIDATTLAEKQRLADISVSYAKRSVAAPGNDADARVALAICLAKVGDLAD